MAEQESAGGGEASAAEAGEDAGNAGQDITTIEEVADEAASMEEDGEEQEEQEEEERTSTLEDETSTGLAEVLEDVPSTPSEPDVEEQEVEAEEETAVDVRQKFELSAEKVDVPEVSTGVAKVSLASYCSYGFRWHRAHFLCVLSVRFDRAVFTSVSFFPASTFLMVTRRTTYCNNNNNNKITILQ